MSFGSIRRACAAVPFAAALAFGASSAQAALTMNVWGETLTGLDTGGVFYDPGTVLDIGPIGFMFSGEIVFDQYAGSMYFNGPGRQILEGGKPFSPSPGTFSLTANGTTLAFTDTEYSFVQAVTGGTSTLEIYNIENVGGLQRRTRFTIERQGVSSVFGFFDTAKGGGGNSYLTVDLYDPRSGQSTEEFRANLTLALQGAGIPEPATWAMMIAGFGIVGASLRRNKPALQVS
jgi:hypothetical protein